MRKMQIVKKKSIFKRISSTFLAMLVAIMCMPTSFFEAAAFGFGFRPGMGPGFGFGWGGPNVLTNASVKFKDAATNKVIGDVESGETFKLVITISGNNVHQFGPTAKYRVEITDGNLLLTNFKDNGFYNGAKYNGYKLVYDACTESISCKKQRYC